jgi:threonylcarbamoyladenosine tRNA methylthiotransferase MtaB
VVRYHVENFGCRTNQADGDAVAARLAALGASRTDGMETADVVVVNTCTVTAEADRDARALIRRIRRKNPHARIVVTGCYAQRAPKEVAALVGVSATVGNSHKDEVASIAMQLVGGPGPGSALSGSETSGDFVALGSVSSPPAESFRPLLLHESMFAHSDFHLPSRPMAPAAGPATDGQARRTRPSLKLQDGCGNRCSFCIIPSTRGASHSLARAEALESVREFADAGGKELTISGINLGQWGRDLAPKERLEDLIDEILETTVLPRLRISSVEPMDWSERLIALFTRWSRGEQPRLARHAHVPLQSGSDSVLRRMHRRYRPWHYAERLAAIHAACPEAAIGADVMVGFPGETDAEFQENYDFIAAQPLTYLHLFPFSDRPGTPAWELNREARVASGAVRERMAALRKLIDDKNLAFRSTFIGRTLSAVTLASRPGDAGTATRIKEETSTAQHGTTNHATALSDNFLPIELGRPYPGNALIQVRISGVRERGVSGEILSLAAPSDLGHPAA